MCGAGTQGFLAATRATAAGLTGFDQNPSMTLVRQTLVHPRQLVRSQPMRVRLFTSSHGAGQIMTVPATCCSWQDFVARVAAKLGVAAHTVSIFTCQSPLLFACSWLSESDQHVLLRRRWQLPV